MQFIEFYCIQTQFDRHGVFHSVGFILFKGDKLNKPDFGCEGRQQGDRAYAVLHGYTLTGPVKWLLSEETLLKCELFDQMWVGTLLGKDGTRKLVSYREGNETYTVLDRDKWEEKLPAQQ